MKKIIDTGVFEAVLCQYNILDITNKEAIRYAREKGVGVFIMGPLAGGRIVSLNVSGIKELALRFVFSEWADYYTLIIKTSLMETIIS